MVGGALGLLLGWWGIDSLLSLVRDQIPRAHEITIDGRVLAFTLSVSLLTGILSGLAPAIQSVKVDLQETL